MPNIFFHLKTSKHYDGQSFITYRYFKGKKKKKKITIFYGEKPQIKCNWDATVNSCTLSQKSVV